MCKKDEQPVDHIVFGLWRALSYAQLWLTSHGRNDLIAWTKIKLIGKYKEVKFSKTHTQEKGKKGTSKPYDR